MYTSQYDASIITKKKDKRRGTASTEAILIIYFVQLTERSKFNRLPML